MQPSFLIAILTGLAAMLGWGFADFFAKKTIDKIGSIVSLVWAHLFGTLALALVALYQSVIVGQQISVPNNLQSWGLLLIFGTLQAVVYLLAYEGFGKGQLAILNPVFASYSGIAALLSIIVFGEIVRGHILVALALVFLGILLLNMDTQILKLKRFNVIPGFREVGLASLLAAIWTIGWDKFVGGQDGLSYALFMYGFMTLAAFVFSKIKRINLSVVKPNLWKFLILIGVCEVVAYVALSVGFSTTSYTSIVVLLSGAFSLPTILLARVFLKEKVSAIQTIGSLIIISGIIILSIL